MIREWLLIVWLGTSTNFTLQGVYWSWKECSQARGDLIKNLGADHVVVCTQDMREGRSQLPRRGGDQGLVK